MSNASPRHCVRRRYGAWLLAGWLGLLFLGPGQAARAELSYRGSWRVEENDEGRLLQSYLNNFGVNLQQQPAERLSATETLLYNRRWDERRRNTEAIMPGADLRLDNELFNSSLGLNSIQQTEKISGRDESTDRVGLNWSSNWDKRWFAPTVMFNASFEQSQGEAGWQLIDREKEQSGGDLAWQSSGVQVYYSYSWYRELDRVSSLEFESDQYLARINATRSWWRDRLRLGVGYSYNETTTARTQTVGLSGVVIQPRQLFEVGTGDDDTPADAVDTVAANNLMRDNDLTNPVAAYAASSPPVVNNIRLTMVERGVNLIYLYTLDNLGANPPGLSWDLYTTEVLGPGTTWNQQSPPAVNYDTINRRFVIRFSTNRDLYLKLVVVMPVLAPDLQFSKVVPNEEIQASAGSVVDMQTAQDHSRGNFNLDHRLSDSWAWYYNFTLQDSTGTGSSQLRQQSHGLGWRFADAARRLDSLISFGVDQRSQSSSTTDDEVETETYKALFEVRKQFLPTLTASASLAHDETRLEGEKADSNNRFKFYADAQLYPDLHSRFETSYQINDRFDAAGQDIGSDRFYMSWQATSRARPSLTVTLTDQYEFIEKHDGERLTETNLTGLNFIWQVSGLLNLSGFVSYAVNKFADDTLSTSASSRVALARDTQLQLDYGRVEGGTTTQTGQIRLLKNFLKFLKWTTSVQYRQDEAGTVPNETKFFSELQVNFATN